MKRRKMPGLAELVQSVDDWNAQHPIGTAVTVTDDFGKTSESKTRSAAWVMGGHSAMILLEGVSGGYMLERVVPSVGGAS